MPSAPRRLDRANQQARHTILTLSRELYDARLSAGLSQVALGAATGLSGAQISRLERGLVRNASLLELAAVGGLLGLRLRVRYFPEASPLRDAGHALLIGRLRVQLGPGLRLRTEVPLGLPGDLRAWDGVLSDGNASSGLEAEIHLHDLQALERRIALKMVDGRQERVILLVAESRNNRTVLRMSREALRDRLPLDSRAVLAHLREGRLPPASGIAVL